MPRTPVVRLQLSMALAVVLSACAARAPATTAATADLAGRYQTAVARAAVVEPASVVSTLVRIDRANPDAQWSADGTAVLMVTWKSQGSYDRFLRDATSTSPDPATVVWVTLAPQVQRFCQAYMRDHPNAGADDLAMRLKQYLGMDPSWRYDLFVELRVKPEDLFRPCVDPEIDDGRCEVAFASPPPRVKGIADYPAFYRNLYFEDFRTRPGVPWTGLGYTYDWGNPRSPVGASEFIITPGGSYRIQGTASTAAYCAVP